MNRCQYNKFVRCNAKEGCDTCEVYKVYQQGRADQKEKDNDFFNFESACKLEEHDAKVRQDFAEKIRSHMTKYCHARLEQQYCAMEVIDFIGKLLGEKDFSIDIEEEIKKHDAKVRADEQDIILDIVSRCIAHNIYDVNEGIALFDEVKEEVKRRVKGAEK